MQNRLSVLLRHCGRSLTALAFLLVAALPANAQSAPATAAATLNPEVIVHTVDRFLRKETRGLPGRVTYTVGALDPRTQLSPCAALEAFLPPGSRLWGNSTVGVRCTAPTAWSIYVPVQVSVFGNYLATAAPLRQGQEITDNDVVLQNGDLAALPSGILTELSQALGKTLRNSVGAGQPLRSDMVQSPIIIRQGQAVRLIANGPGFAVTGEGTALSNAAEGQTVQVRTPTGTTTSGIARSGGIVEIKAF
jgi:flagella basal body P-ring formation protein FlgA